MNERRQKLMNTMKSFNKKNKTEVFTLASELKTTEVLPSGIKTIDKFIGGGFKPGGHTIIWGRYSVGKTALALMTIANAQREGKLVCYVNTEKPIDPERFKFFGINLEEMVYIEAPENAEQALEAMRTLCKDKVIDLFIIDSTNGLCPKSVQETAKGAERGLEKNNVASLPKTLSNFYNVVNAYVFRSKAVVLWIGQARTKGIGSFFAHLGLTGGNAQEFYAYQIMSVRRGEKTNNPVKKFKVYFIDPEGKIRFSTKTEDIGFDTVFKLTKTNSAKSAKENSEIHVPFLYEKGFVDEVIEDDNVPIKIDPMCDDQEKEMIKEYLIEKGLMKKFSINDKSIEVITEQAIYSEELDKDTSDMLNLEQEPEIKKTIDDVPVKKKRGRPKKEKS